MLASLKPDRPRTHNRQDNPMREPMIFFRFSDRLGQALTKRARIGSEGICVPPCVP